MHRHLNPNGLSMARGLKFILVIQAVVAGLLLLTDVGTRWTFSRAFETPGPADPVSPGDQVRDYEPRRSVPRFVTPSDLPDRVFPADLPTRLEFTVADDPSFGRVLMMNGAIEAGDARRFEAHLESLGEAPTRVALNSPGGNVDEALEIGRLLRDRELDTLLLGGTACLSSCPYIFAAGVERLASTGGVIGLHQHYYDAPGYMPVYFAVEDIQRNQGETMAYLIEMGVDPGVMVHGLSTPPQEIYVLVEDELLDSGLATSMVE